METATSHSEQRLQNIDPYAMTYTVEEAQRILKAGKTKIWSEIASGRIESTRVGKRRLLWGDSVRARARGEC